MKNLIRLLSCFSMLFLVEHHQAQAQNIVNGDFSLGANSTDGRCTQIMTNDVPNWLKSHGTPDYNGNEMLLVASDDYSINTLFSSVLGGYGEGILGGYNFIQGVTYNIELEIQIHNAHGPNRDAIVEIFGATGISEGPGTIFTGGSNATCLSPAPTIPASQLQHVESTPGTASLTLAMSTWNKYKLQFTPTANWDQLWIYLRHKDNPGNNRGITYLYLKEVKIWACTEGSVQYFNTINDGLTDKKTIYTGHNTPGVTNITFNSSYSNTTFIGWDIQLKDNTYIDVTADFYFLAVAVDECNGEEQEEPGGGDDPGSGTHSMIRQKEDDKKGSSNLDKTHETLSMLNVQEKTNNPLRNVDHKLRSQNIGIHPNPTTGSFNVTMQQAGNYNIRVMNMMGAIVYETQLNGEQQKSIQLNQSLPAGTYTIQVSGEGQMHVEKLILIK